MENNKYNNHTLIFYEAPHKLLATLKDMQEYFGGERKIALARELTKLHEEIIRTTISGALDYYSEKSPRGEYVLVVEGASDTNNDDGVFWQDMTVTEHVDQYINDGMTQKDAIKATAVDRNVPKRDIYAQYHEIGD